MSANVFDDVPWTAESVYDTETGRNFFIGRIEHDGIISPGKVKWRESITYAADGASRTGRDVLSFQVTSSGDFFFNYNCFKYIV